MQQTYLNLFDKDRSRKIPLSVYLPEMKDVNNIPVFIFNPSYQTQEELGKSNVVFKCNNYKYLANYFTGNGYAFVAMQHEMLGDNDGLEVIDSSLPQNEARKHLYQRGMENILFVINELKRHFPKLKTDKFILGGHSNGGDIAKYYANHYPKTVSNLILLDARRCFIKPKLNLRILMFEAPDSSTDIGVLPDEGTKDNPKRKNLEWVIVKPKNATHSGYSDSYIPTEVRKQVINTIEWFLK
ncbi:MAG: alpha/beta hydrolase [Rickettsiaceae bacterium]|nr:alpha/beta hydrolase [Rickettsiaceae bacterium]